MAQPKKNDRRMNKERLARRKDAVKVKVRDRPRCVGLKRINGSGRGDELTGRGHGGIYRADLTSAKAIKRQWPLSNASGETRGR